jgi:hypothetical protein
MRFPNLKIPVFAAKVVVLASVMVVPQFLLAQYDISTVAGGGPSGLGALKSSIGYPGSIAFDSTGNAYIADSWSSRILKVTPGGSTGTVTIVAGNGTHGYSGDGGPATSATLDGPVGVALDTAGNIYIADFGNSLVREVTVANGQIQTIAGNYTAGAGYSGDGGAATSAQLNGPLGLFVDSSGNVFIADSLNDAVREVVASTNVIQTVAGDNVQCADPTTTCGDGGPATSANLDLPSGVFVDASGNIFIADTYTARVRVVNPNTSPSTTIAGVTIPLGDIQTVAGAYYNPGAGETCGTYASTPPLVALNTDLCGPTGVFVDASKDIFVADSGYSVIWEIAAASTNIAPVAGNGTAGYSGDTNAPTSAQLDDPNEISVDASGDIFIADTDNYVIREVSAGIINTVIGNNTLADSGDGGSAVDAELNYPGGVFVDGAGDLFIADSVSSVIREVPAGGNIKTVAGEVKTPCVPATATCGDGGSAASAQFNNPFGVVVDGSGNIYVADTEDNRIRVVNAAGNVATVAGTGNQCTGTFTWPCGDGGAAISAELFSPFGVAVDSAGNLFIADTKDHAIRVVNIGSSSLVLAGVTIGTGQIATVAGNGTACQSSVSGPCGDGGPSTSAQLNGPWGVFVDSAENIYIADSGDNAIRVVNTGTSSTTVAGVTVGAGQIATVAGTGKEGYSGDGSAATSAQLAAPASVYVDSSGNIFISDTANFVVREVVQGSTTSGSWDIATVAGDNTQGFSGDGGVATSADINTAIGLFGDSNSNLYLADTDNSRIRKLTITAGSTPTASSPTPQTTSPGGSATFDIQLKADTGDPRYAITLSCLQSSLPANATCSFSPAKITPGPLPVPFTLTITVPATSASLAQPAGMKLQLVFGIAFAPLVGILFAGVGLGKKRRWLLLAGLGVSLILLNACGGSSSALGTSYSVQVQGTTTVQPTPVTITTATLTVQ